MFLCQNKCVYKTNCLKEVQMRLSNKHITHRKRIKTKRIGIEMNLCTSYDCFYTHEGVFFSVALISITLF